MIDNESIVIALKELDKVASVLAGDAVRYGVSLEEAYLNRFAKKRLNAYVGIWLGAIKDECKAMTGAKIYVVREHMPK